jgi:hypothetical protein
MAINMDRYSPVVVRLLAALEKHAKDNIRIITDLIHVERDSSGKPLQYICRTQIWFGDVLKAQDLAEEMVGSSNVNKYSALENCSTSSCGRALALIGFVGSDPVTKEPVRPTREEMEKVARAEANAQAEIINKVVYSQDQIDMAAEGIEQVSSVVDLAELKLLYTGAQQAGLLHIPVGGKTLNTVINTKKKELEAK